MADWPFSAGINISFSKKIRFSDTKFEYYLILEIYLYFPNLFNLPFSTLTKVIYYNHRKWNQLRSLSLREIFIFFAFKGVARLKSIIYEYPSYSYLCYVTICYLYKFVISSKSRRYRLSLLRITS